MEHFPPIHKSHIAAAHLYQLPTVKSLVATAAASTHTMDIEALKEQARPLKLLPDAQG